MSKEQTDAVLDAMLAEAEGDTFMILENPATGVFATDNAAKLAGGAISGSYTKGPGDVDGRKNTFPAQSAVDIDANGTANWLAIYNATTYVQQTSVSAQALVQGGTVDVPTWDHTIRDPS